jgi:hypothetical protein
MPFEHANDNTTDNLTRSKCVDHKKMWITQFWCVLCFLVL